MEHRARVLVTGAGGFLGHHLVAHLKGLGYWVRGVDHKLPPYGATLADEYEVIDLRRWEGALHATREIDEVYALAARMGGIGYIQSHKAAIMHDSVLMSTHTIEAARVNGARRYLFTSSACVYPGYRQLDPDAPPLREEDAYPADPEDGYGWEKLFTERICRHYRDDHGLETRVARLHTMYGPLGVYDGGKEKAPAAICRKVALAADGGEIEVWGDGEQTRTYCYVDDCLDGLHRLMRSDWPHPINLGDDRLVSVNELVEIVARIAGKRIRRRHLLGAPQGVRGRTPDGSRAREVLGWRPRTPLEEGLARTYGWIRGDMARRPDRYALDGDASPAVPRALLASEPLEPGVLAQ